MLNLIKQRYIFFYKYMLGFMFLQISIFSNIHYHFSERVLKYYNYIFITCLLMIIFFCEKKEYTSAIMLFVTILILNNILYLKKFLQENFLAIRNYY